MSYLYLFKYILVGDTGVGKSCLLLQFTDKKFEQNHDITIGVEFGTRIIDVGEPGAFQKVKLQCFDTAGQETFRSITRAYYRNSALAILVFDVTRRSTFTKLDSWIKEIKKHNGQDVRIILVANKADLNTIRMVSTEEGQAFADVYEMPYFETSAKTGKNVDQIFTQSAEEIYRDILSGKIEISKETGIKIGGHLRYQKVDLKEREQESKCFC